MWRPCNRSLRNVVLEESAKPERPASRSGCSRGCAGAASRPCSREPSTPADQRSSYATSCPLPRAPAEPRAMALLMMNRDHCSVDQLPSPKGRSCCAIAMACCHSWPTRRSPGPRESSSRPTLNPPPDLTLFSLAAGSGCGNAAPSVPRKSDLRHEQLPGRVAAAYEREFKPYAQPGEADRVHRYWQPTKG